MVNSMIRKTTDKDLYIVYEMICNLENKKLNKQSFKDVFLSQLSDMRYCSFVYEDNNVIQGFINCRIEPQLHHNKKIMDIMELIVLENYRNKGIGHQLIDYVKQIASSNDCEKIELNSSNWRKDAHRFYENNVFDKSHVNMTFDL